MAANLAAAARLIAEAARAGAKLAAAENFYLIGRHEGDKVAVREADGKGPVQDFLASAAKENRVWIIGGTAPSPAKMTSASGRVPGLRRHRAAGCALRQDASLPIP